MLNKRYLSFLVTLAMFSVILVYSVVLYVKWDNEATNGVSEVEISLPVIEWGKYNNLSKQPD